MSAHHIILASLPSLYQKWSVLVKIWQSYKLTKIILTVFLRHGVVLWRARLLECDLVCMQTCCCGKGTRSVLCGSQDSFEIRYLCGKVCGRDLDCGCHHCDQLCHPGPCDGCPLQPSRVTHCPCGKTTLDKIPTAKPRRKCTDEVPTCQLTCLKPLLCGTDGNFDFFLVFLLLCCICWHALLLWLYLC